MSDTLWSDMWRRVEFVLCVAVGAIGLVAYVATNAVMGAWPRAFIFAIAIYSLFNAHQIWKGLSDSRDPDQPAAPPRDD
jgi:hypothetical protein